MVSLESMFYIGIKNIIRTGKGFHQFSEKTAKLLLGSKNKTTNLSSVNIINILGKCEKRYPSLIDTYNDLSESLHPNYQGVMLGYSTLDYDDMAIAFKNCWAEISVVK